MHRQVPGNDYIGSIRRALAEVNYIVSILESSQDGAGKKFISSAANFTCSVPETYALYTWSAYQSDHV